VMHVRMDTLKEWYRLVDLVRGLAQVGLNEVAVLLWMHESTSPTYIESLTTNCLLLVSYYCISY
jgi:hypothetical protein